MEVVWQVGSCGLLANRISVSQRWVGLFTSALIFICQTDQTTNQPIRGGPEDHGKVPTGSVWWTRSRCGGGEHRGSHTQRPWRRPSERHLGRPESPTADAPAAKPSPHWSSRRMPWQPIREQNHILMFFKLLMIVMVTGRLCSDWLSTSRRRVLSVLKWL